MNEKNKNLKTLIRMIIKWMDTIDETSKDGVFYLNKYGTKNLREDLNYIWSELYDMNNDEEEIVNG